MKVKIRRDGRIITIPQNKYYRTIYSDPPWPEYGGGRITRGAQRHYPLMKIPDIEAFYRDRVSRWANDDAHLYLWATNNFLEHAFRIVHLTGFRYITTITWMKDRPGLGQYYRGMTEHCIFAVRGRLPYRYHPTGKRAQGLTGFIEPRKQHSEKPATMRRMIETVSYPPYLELFARQLHQGWDAWGNEVPAVTGTPIA